jgi:hypothetical protein
MHIDQWLAVSGMVVAMILGFAAIYEKVIAARFRQRAEEVARIWGEIKAIGNRCIGHMEHVGQVGADIRNLGERMGRVENKIDKLLSKNGVS